ncbi:hypothetical protein RUM44_008399 [Polyplax serrata]|uniref:C2H2-type domain-containing protein n=1 Tax=Polyplax serrata TaxID=468196 RepID=A0ABR1BCM0_POLSC
MSEKDTVTHKCVLCNAALESKEALQEHFRKHANKEVDNRGVPAKSKISTKKVFKKELPDIKKEKIGTITCDVCGQEFTNNSVAIQHKFKKHPDVTCKHICPYCGMQFTIKALFDNHVGTHMSDGRDKRSVLCDECGAQFYFQEAKDYHYKSTHKRVKTLFQPVPTPPPSKKIKMDNAGEIQSVYYCHLCGSEYIIKFNLQKHLEKAHTEHERSTLPSDLIRCTTCDALFYNQKAYETHNLSHKPHDLYVTSEQQRLQTVSRVDQDFDIRRVLPLATKYLPSYKHKSKTKTGADFNRKKDVREEELSPPSTPESTESDSDGDAPLVKLKSNSGCDEQTVDADYRET